MGEFMIKIKKVKEYNFESNPKLLLVFLNNSVKNIMRKLNYMAIGKTGEYFKTN